MASIRSRVAAGTIAFLASAAPLLAQSAAPLKAQIAATSARWDAAVKAGDPAALAALYTDDAQLLPPGSTPVNGTKAITEFWKGAFASVKGSKLETLEVGGHGDTAHEVGRYTLYGANGDPVDQGKYIVLWRKVGGTWKLHRDIWNSSPAAGQKTK